MATLDLQNRVTEYLLANPTATNKDVAASVGCSPRTVGYARSTLVASGSIPPAWGDKKSRYRRRKSAPQVIPATEATSEGVPFDTQSTADLNAKVAEALLGANQPMGHLPDDDEDIDFNKLKRILWRIARYDPDNRVRTTAIWTLTRVQQDVSDRPLGPGIPRTRAAIVERLLELFEGVGADIVIETMNLFLEKRKVAS